MRKSEINTGWEVEWCDYVLVEDGEMFPDTARYRYRDFTDKGKATEYAKKVLSKDVFGSVRIISFYSEPYEPGLPACYREYDGEPEYIERE